MAETRIATLVGRLVIDAKGWNAGMTRIQKSLERAGTSMFFVGSRITAGVTVPLGALAAAAIKAGAEFDQAMTESLAIMTDINPQIRKSMEDTAKSIALQTKFSSKEAAEAYFFLASSGMNAAESMRALPVAAKFAQAGVIGLERATELLSDAYISLGLRIKDDAVANMQQMQRVADVLTEANNLAQGSIEEFAEALTNRAAVAMRTFGISVEEGVAVLAAFAERGIKGKKAGQQFFIVVRDLQRSFLKMPEAWEELVDVGAVFDKATGSFKNMADIIESLEKALANMSDQGKKSKLQMLGFQERSLQATLALVGASQDIRDFQTAFEDAGGVVDRVANLQMQSFSNQMHVINERLTQLKIALFETFRDAFEREILPTVKDGIRTLEHLVQWLGTLSTEGRSHLLKAAGAIAAFGPGLAILGSMTLMFQGLAPIWRALSVPLMVLTSAVKDFFKIWQLFKGAGVAKALLTLLSPISKITLAVTSAVAIWGIWKRLFPETKSALEDNIDTLGVATGELEKQLEKYRELVGLTKRTVEQKREFDRVEKQIANALGITTEALRTEMSISGNILILLDEEIKKRKELAAQKIAEANAAVDAARREEQRIRDQIANIQSGRTTLEGQFIGDVPAGSPEAAARNQQVLSQWRERHALVMQLTEDLAQAHQRTLEASADRVIVNKSLGATYDNLTTSVTNLTDASELSADQRAREQEELDKLSKTYKEFRDDVDGLKEEILGINSDALPKLLVAFDELTADTNLTESQTARLWEIYKKLRPTLEVLPPVIEELTTDLREQEEATKFLTTRAGKFIASLTDTDVRYAQLLNSGDKLKEGLIEIGGAIPVSHFENQGEAIKDLASMYGKELGPELRYIVDEYFKWAIAAEESSIRAKAATAAAVKFTVEKHDNMAATLKSKTDELALFSLNTQDRELIGLKKGYEEMKLSHARTIADMVQETALLPHAEAMAMLKRIEVTKAGLNGILAIEEKIGLLRLAESLGINERMLEQMGSMQADEIKAIITQEQKIIEMMRKFRDQMEIIGNLGNLFSSLGGMFAGLGAFITTSTTQAKAFGEAWAVAASDTANNAQKAVAGIQMATAAVQAFQAVSEIAGRGKRTAAGAGAGAQMGSVFGPWGAAIGAGLGALVGAIMDDPGWVKIQNAIGKQFGVSVTDELAKQIDETAEEVGSHWGAMMLHLNDIIEETGGVNAQNVDKWTREVRDAFSMTEFGALTVSEATEVLDENFRSLADAGTLSSGVLKANVAELMLLDEQFGTASEAVKEFKTEMISMMAEGLALFSEGVGDIATPFMETFDKALAEAKQAHDAMVKEALQEAKGSSEEELEALRQTLEAKWLQTEQEMRKSFRDNFTEEIKNDWRELNTFTELTFFAMRESGMSFLEILEVLDPQLEQLNELINITGENGGDAIEQLLRIRHFKSENEGLIKQIEGLNQMMLGLANSGLMSQESFTAFSSAATRQFEQLIEKGLDNNEALMLMAPTLQTLADLQREYGLVVDEDTQKILDLAGANGILRDSGKDTNTILTEGLLAVAEGLGELIHIFGGTLPDSIRALSGVVESEIGGQVDAWTEYGDVAIDEIERIARNQFDASEDMASDLRSHLSEMGGEYQNFVDETNNTLDGMELATMQVEIDVEWGDVPDLDVGMNTNPVEGFQHGGIIDRPGLFMGGEGGEPEMIGPVSFMSAALKGALDTSDAGSNDSVVKELRGMREQMDLLPLHLRDAIILSQ